MSFYGTKCRKKINIAKKGKKMVEKIEKLCYN